MGNSYDSAYSNRKLIVEPDGQNDGECLFSIKGVPDQDIGPRYALNLIASKHDTKRIVRQLCEHYKWEVVYTPPTEESFEVVQV